MKDLPPLFMREEPAFCRQAGIRQKFPSALDNDQKIQELIAKIKAATAAMGYRRRYPRNVKPEDGDIVAYYDEAATRPMFREHWWELPPGERKKLRAKSFISTGYWEGSGARRRLVWLERKVS